MASQEEFLKNQVDEQNQSKASNESEILTTVQDRPIDEDGLTINERESTGQVGSPIMKRRRDRLMEEARRSVPEGGCGKVMHLVKAFEKLLTIRSSKNCDEKEKENEEDNLANDDQKKATKFALPGLQPSPKSPETEISSSSSCPSDLFLTSESLGLDPPISASSCDVNSIRENEKKTNSIFFEFSLVFVIFVVVAVYRAGLLLEVKGVGAIAWNRHALLWEGGRERNT